MQQTLILTAVPDGTSWLVKIVTPKGESVRSAKRYETRRQALDAAARIAAATGGEVMP